MATSDSPSCCAATTCYRSAAASAYGSLSSTPRATTSSPASPTCTKPPAILTLLNPKLAAALADHAMGNYRVLTNRAAELLVHAAQRELTELDEKLFFDVFNPERSA